MTDKPARKPKTHRVHPNAPPRKPGKMGAPSNVDLDDPETVDMICRRIAGGEAVYKVCDDLMISSNRIYERMATDPDF